MPAGSTVVVVRATLVLSGNKYMCDLHVNKAFKMVYQLGYQGSYTMTC